MSSNIRIGFGYDVHTLTENRKLVLGGVEVPHEKGLMGHSDADVLLHAICDAILGALALGDIGKHFPNSDPKYKGIDSKKLLKEVYELITEHDYAISNIDSTVVIQEPKIMPYVTSMRTVIAGVLNLKVEQVSVKATTSEKMGFVGKQQGAEAYAIALLYKKEN